MIFIDTGAFLARHLSRDQHHAEAVAGWQALANAEQACSTSNFVLDELLTLLGRRAGFTFAAERARALYASSVLTILRPDRDCEVAAIAWMERYADQRVSFTDCVSFELMHNHRIDTAFTFDRHFELAGFRRWRA
ncbi:PIN domain-containing protein [uncultured Thiohalocapsa sp.]|uniref:type II toxin-antitoxin system VapC family toxin n=1 Tax=uncultured Thiohalocapsa sp. TaxID=768990 RepID=UPI0025CE5875|nr:PIN domain-containing protein [uncultured Thiohalocapsa sp.]